MRDIFVTAVVFGSLPFILKRPYIGIYMFSWLGYMNPHRLTWGFAYDFPFAYIVALTTLLGILFSREPKKIPWTRETILLLIFICWMFFTTFFAFYPHLAWLQMEKVAKIQLMVFLTLMLVTSRERLHVLVWIIALSLGFYGVKGGIFTALHGGVYHVRGPLGTFIGGNNEVALALIMTLPLMRYLQLEAKALWVRHGLTAAMILTALAIIGSQSRGAFLGIAAMGLFLWLKSRNKLFTGLMIAGAAALIVSIMPAQWYARMRTIETYQHDASAEGRINAWGMAINLAKDRPIVGGGFDTFQRPTFRIYAPNPNDVHDAHSIYFEVLAEHGFVGLALFLLLGLGTWRTAGTVIKAGKRDPSQKWAADLAAMIQVSIVGFASSGAFLGLAYFDLWYHLIAIVVLCKVITVRQRAKIPAATPRPAGAPAGRRSAPAMAGK